ncbi:MAG: hypothetical protein G01um101431_800 [Parcubacteria group bacterium Gr01-1014_31]|nr:MAG: hypothetical protein G01um101431_800 [Parcubacteria group bacterium Gr01-1014_31]
MNHSVREKNSSLNKKWLLFRLYLYPLTAIFALLLLFFSNPNRLAHDQIDHKLFFMLYDEPGLFADDYLWGSERRKLVDNRYSFAVIKRLGQWSGSDEIARWLLVPIAFFVFTIGMFELAKIATNEYFFSYGVAVLSNIHIPHVLSAEWGLPGPSEIDPWVFYQSLTPFILVLFCKGVVQRNEWMVLLAFAISGFLGNIHIISAFYLVGILTISYIVSRGTNIINILKSLIYALISVILSLPYVLRHIIDKIPHPLSFNAKDPAAWEAINTIANHTTLRGRLANINAWVVGEWHLFWPFLLALVALLIIERKWRSNNVSTFSKFAVRFILATVFFNAAFSVLQIFRLYVLHQLPFWNEPRGMQLIYFVLFPALGLLGARLWQRAQAWWSFERQLIAIAIVVLTVGLGVRVSLPLLTERYRVHITPRYSFDTCDAQLYRTFNRESLPRGPVLIDPGYWSAFRICTRRAAVVQNRDKAFAYSQGADTMMEWYRRFNEANAAFASGGEQLLQTAKKYQSRVIVSRYCVSLPAIVGARRIKVADEGCIDVLTD